jgi:hypothetical protein
MVDIPRYYLRIVYSHIEAYCERNRVLGELLDNKAGQAWSMLPSLLQVAKQIPSTRVTHLIRGLLRNDESIEMLPII